VKPSESLCAAKLRNDLGSVTIGREIVVLEETVSTNDVVQQMAAGESPEGLVVFAEHQSGGRGQRGNKWESAPHKGLWFSILLRPQLDLKDSGRLTDWTAKMIVATIESCCLVEASIKRPNDIVVAGRKVAGVLVEMRAQPRAPHVAIVGIGLNVNQTPSDFSKDLRDRATSLAIVRRSRIDRHRLAVELLQNLDRAYAEFRGR